MSPATRRWRSSVQERDGYTHLEQIAVRIDQTRRGIGTALLDRVVAHAAETSSRLS